MANPLGGVGAADMIDIGLKDDFQTWLFSFGTYVRISFECLKLRKMSFILFDKTSFTHREQRLLSGLLAFIALAFKNSFCRQQYKSRGP